MKPHSDPSAAHPQKRNPSIPAWAIWLPVFAVISAVSLPEPSARSILAPLGLVGATADAAAHAIPVVLATLIVALSSMILRGRSQAVQIAVLFVSGGLTGFFTAFFLALFGRVSPLVAAWIGDLRAPQPADIVGWAIAGFSLMLAVMVWAIAVFGASAARAMSAQNLDPEDEEFRTAERQTFGLSAIGCFGQALCVAGIVLANQLLAPSLEVKLALAGITVLGVVLFTWSSLRLWRDFDEMMRRVVMDAYAWSAILLTPVLVVWALLGALKLAPEISAYTAFLAMIAAQTVCSLGLSAAKQTGAQITRAAE